MPRFRRLFRFPWRTDHQIDQDLDAEVQFHLEMRTEELIDQGAAPAAASEEARRGFGDMEETRRYCRSLDQRLERQTAWRMWLDELRQDLRYSARGLAKSPTVTVVAVLSLAIGIGVNTAVFSVVDAMVFRPFPYDNPDRLVMLRAFETLDPTSTRGPWLDEYLSWKQRTDVFAEMAFENDFRNIVVSSEGHPTEELRGLRVSTNLFATLGVEPLLGRGFILEDGQPGAENVVVLSDSMWQRRFGGSTGVIGETLWLSDTAATIVGVMPSGFYLSNNKYPFWLPTPGEDAAFYGLGVIARLAPGVTIEQAQVAIDIMAAHHAAAFPETSNRRWRGGWEAVPEGWGVRLVPHHEFFTRDLRPTLLVLWGAVGFVLLIASANVAGVLLARASSRAQEIAMRRALGASRWRVGRLFLTEGVLLALAGGVVGSVLAYAALEIIHVLDPAGNPALALGPTFPRLNDAGWTAARSAIRC